MRIASLWYEPPYWLSNTEWSTMKPYTHKQQKGTQQNISISIKDKDETNLRMNERDPGMDNWEESV